MQIDIMKQYEGSEEHASTDEDHSAPFSPEKRTQLQTMQMNAKQGSASGKSGSQVGAGQAFFPAPPTQLQQQLMQ